MYAIIDAGGHQHRVSVGDRIRVDQTTAEVGKDLTFDRVLFVAGKEPKIGTPTVSGASVVAKVVSHGLGDKVIAYKYQQRNHARRKQGFRHHFTEVEITAIKGA
jgi:large subunit ribosomal protein L21